MKFVQTLFFITIIAFNSCKQGKKSNSEQIEINVELKNKLESILLKDQGIREIVDGSLNNKRKVFLLNEMKLNETDIEGNKKFDLMSEIDSINLLETENIIKNHGYPSKSLVGEPANKAVFYVIQHSNKIEEYLPLIRKASENGDIAKTSLAMMEDRNLMNKGIEQLYGTQIKGQANKKGEWIYFLWPIKNADSINIWRKEIGFKQNVEEYVKEMGVEFRLYQINELSDL
jgi:hypothetical protein